MKNIFKTALASIVLMASCATDEEVVLTQSTPDTFYASIEVPATRTYADEAGKLLWTANDQITIFKGSTKPLIYKFNGETGQNYGGFTNVTPDSGDDFVTANPLDANYAIYPHAANTTISNAGVFNFTIPATQSYAENSFGLGANVMVAVTEDKSDNNLSFKNLGGYFEFSLYGEGTTVKSIEFKGNNGENLAGKVAITASHDGNPTFEFVGEATKTLTLDCGAGVALGTEANPTTFWFVVPAMTYSNGITITITDANDKVMEKSTSKSITIDRSTLQPLNAFLVETRDANTPPNNQIWYTSMSKLNPYTTDGFGANIVSNEWDNMTGAGVITFDGDVTSIGDEAFCMCWSLTSISIPESVTSIGEKAFLYCDYLISIVIPDSVNEISHAAFCGCDALIYITMPDNLNSIGERAFCDCRSLTSITIPEGVTSIGDEAFCTCWSLTSISIPESVTSFGESVFQRCDALEAFYGKFASDDNRCIIIDGVLTSFAPAGLTTYNIPENITEIGDEAFSYCYNLESITIPDSITAIGIAAFSGCDALEAFYGKFASADNRCLIIDGVLTSFASAGLTTYNIPENITEIGDEAFSYCDNLESITIPEGVTTIGYFAFDSCPNLTSITIPESITEIKVGAFYGVGYDLDGYLPTNIYCKATTPPKLNASTFPHDGHDNLKIYVPQASVETYKTANIWNYYANYIEGYNF